MNFTEILIDKYLELWYAYILSPIINYGHNELSSYVDYHEDEIFKTLYPHEGAQISFYLCKLPQILPFTVYLVPLVIQILGGFSIGWFLYITFKYICGKSKKSLRKMESILFLRLKIVLSFLILILLCLTAIAAYRLNFLLDLNFRNAIKKGSDVVNKIREEKTKFELQLSDVNTSIFNTISSVEKAINELPKSIQNVTYNTVKMEFINSTANYNEIMMKTNYIFENSGMKKIHSQVEQMLEKELKLTEKLMNMFNQNTEILMSNITNKEVILNEINQIKTYSNKFRGKYKFTNWTDIYNILQDTYNKVLPEWNTSMLFIHQYPINIRKNIEPNVNEIKDIMHKFHNKTEFIIDKVQHIMQQIFHSRAANNIRKIIEYSNNTEVSINRNTTIGCKNVYPTTLILLIPLFHTFFYLICMLQCVICVAYQVYKFNKGTTSNIPCFQVVTGIGLMLLWTGLLLSVLCYLGALALSTICRPLHTQRLYTQYIDNQREWNNKTWLDAVVYPWNHNYKLKNILEKCSDDVTVYQAFGVDEYWKVSQEFQNYKVNINNAELIELIKNAIKDVQLPTGRSCIEARDNFNLIEKDLAHCSSYIMDDVELFENSTLKNLLLNITNKYSFEKLGQNLDILNFIQNQNLGYLLNNFMEFKYLLKSNQNHLNNIQKSQEQIVNKIKLNIDSIIENEVIRIEKYINGVMDSMEQDLSYNIKYKYGNCRYYSTATKIIRNNICEDLPLILNMAWIILTFNAILMLISIVLNRNLVNDVARLRQECRKKLKREAQERMLKHRQRLMDGTLLFN